MGPHGVVVVPEPVELRLQLLDGGGRSLLGQPPLQRLVEPLHLAAGLGMVGRRVDWARPAWTETLCPAWPRMPSLRPVDRVWSTLGVSRARRRSIESAGGVRLREE